MVGNPADGQWLAFSLAPVFFDAALKSVLVLLAALATVGCMRKCSAAARHLVLFLAVVSLLFLPLLSLKLPEWHVLPHWLNPQFHEATKQTFSSQVETITPTARPAQPAEVDAPVENYRTSPESIPSSPAPPRKFFQPSHAQIQQPAAPHESATRVSSPQYTFWIWILGAAFALLPLVLGSFSLWRLEHSSRRETCVSWLDLLRSLIARLEFRRTAALLKTHRRRMPMTWGILRAKLLLPEESETWTGDRRRVVLLHELAHAKRWDYLSNLVTQFVCALYWFNPLVWFAARQMVVERERACDDIVLRHGAKPADYAEQILQIAAGLRLDRFTAFGGIPMARPSKLEGRLRAILDNTRNRAALTRMMVIGVVALLAAIVTPVAMMRAASGEQSQSGKSVENRKEQLINQASVSTNALHTTNENLNFGPMTNGLRAAVELIAASADFQIGQPIQVRFHIRNAADHPIQIASVSCRQNDELILETESGDKVLNELGAPVTISMTTYHFWSPTQRQVLKPGEEMVLESTALAFFNDDEHTTADPPFPVGYAIHTKPGRYVIRFRLEFPFGDVQPNDWKGELKTGRVTIDVKGNARSSGGASVQPRNVGRPWVLSDDSSTNGQLPNLTAEIEISLGHRKITGIEFRGSREWKYPLAFRLQNIGRTNISGLDILNLMRGAVVHARSDEGVELTNAFRRPWGWGSVPEDVQPGQTYVDSTDGDLLTFFPSATNGTYDVWWTRGALKSNPLRFTVRNGEITLVTDPNGENAVIPPQQTDAQSGVGVTTSVVTNVPPLERMVTLNAQQMPLKNLLAEVCRQANLKLELDTAGLEKVHVSPDSPVSLSFTNEPLTYAIIAILRRFEDQQWLVWELRGETLHVRSLLSNQAGTGSLPEWLKRLQGRGAHAEVDAAGNVISLYAGDIANDEFLANARTLPKLRELRIEGIQGITREGLAHLAEMQALEMLQLWSSMPHTNTGWGDEALRQVSRVKTLRELWISPGVTDAGARALETMTQLQVLGLPNTPLTEAALRSVTVLTNLKKLVLSFGVSSIGLRQLSSLTNLEELRFDASIAGRFVAFPRLKVLSVSGEHFADADFDALVQCRELRELNIAGISDAGLRRITEMKELRQLDVNSQAITDAGIAQLKVLPKLERLSIHTSQSDASVRQLSEIKSLFELTVYGPRSFGAESQQRLTVEGLLQLKKLPHLRSLTVHGVQASNGILQLRELTHLLTLTLYGYDISDKELDWLRRIMPGTWVGSMNFRSTGSVVLAGEQPRALAPLPKDSVFVSGRAIDDVSGGAVIDGVIEFGSPDPARPGEIIWGTASPALLMEMSGNNPTDPSQFWGESFRGGKVWARILARGYAPALLTLNPVEAPLRLTNLLVRMKPGSDLRGTVVDHTGKPAAGVGVYLADTAYFSLLNVEARRAQESSATTDANGRFALAGGNGTEQRVVATSLDGQLFAVAPKVGPDREVTISLPQPATLIVRYDIPDDSPVTRINLNYETHNLDPGWTNLSFSLRPAITNGQETVLTNLTPGTYRFIRGKTGMFPDRGGGGLRSAILEQRSLTLAAGQTQRVDLVRSIGHSIRGEIAGLRQTGAPGASIYAFSGQMTNDLVGIFKAQRPVDLVTCSDDGQFHMGRLEPGAYTIVAVVEKDLGWAVPRTGQPDFVGTAEVNITADGPPPEPLKIELLPWATATNQAAIPPTNRVSGYQAELVAKLQAQRDAELVAQLKTQCDVYPVYDKREGVQRPIKLSIWFATEAALKTVGKFRGIEDLEFVGTDLRSSAFDGVGNIRSLKRLSTSNCQLLPHQLETIGRLTQLEHLELDMSGIFYESAERRAQLLGNLTPGEIQRSNALRQLRMDDSVIQAALLTDRAMPHLGHLVRLRTLRLINSYMTPAGLEQLKPLVNLEVFDLCPVGLDAKSLDVLRGMTRLRSLRYFNADDAMAATLSEIGSLEDLEIWSGDVTDMGAGHLVKLKKLRRLAIRGNQMTGHGIATLAQLPALKQLDLSYAERISPSDLDRFRELRPDVDIKPPEPLKIGLLPWAVETNRPAAQSRVPPKQPISTTEQSQQSAANEPNWGEPVQGVQLRLHARRTRWTTNEQPQLLVDIGNHGASRFQCPTNSDLWELEVDGRWYGWSFGARWGWGPQSTEGPDAGETVTNVPFSLGAEGDTQYVLGGGDLQRIKLTPGKHIIRIKIDGGFDQSRPVDVQATSNPLEIEIAESATTSPLASNEHDATSGWGEATNGLRTRIWAETKAFRAGQPIPLKLEVTNWTDAARTFESPSAPWNSGLIVFDSHGNPVPYIAGSSQLRFASVELAPHSLSQPRVFNLADFYYVRSPDRYTVIWTNELILPEANSKLAPLPPAPPFTFEVVPDTEANADGDPIGKLLPLLKENWSIGTGGTHTNRVQPGSNRREVAGRLLTLQYNPTGYIADGGLVWLWLTDEVAGEIPQTGDWPPPSEQLGHLSRWLGYFNASTNALRAWPTVREDIIEAFTGIGAQLHLHASRTRWTTGEAPELLVDLSNFGKVPFDFPTNTSLMILEIDDHWFTGTDAGGAMLQMATSNPGEILTNFPIILNSSWMPDKPLIRGERLLLTPGKHVVRMRYPVSPSDDASKTVHLLSNPIEIEIAPPVSHSRSDWGEPVGGVALRLVPDKLVWKTNEIITAKFSLRNQSTNEIGWSAVEETGVLEIDGVKYVWRPGTMKDIATPVLPAGEQLDDLQVQIGSYWQTNARPHELLPFGPEMPLKLAPGKHTVRLRINAVKLNSTSNDIHLLSNPVEIEINSSDAGFAAESRKAGDPDEAARNGPNPAEFSGHVVEDATGEPVTNIVLQPGIANPQKPDEIQWREEFLGPWLGKPGFFSVQTSNPWETWRVLADGYLPELVVAPPNSPSASANDLVIRLKHGGELRGTVFNHAGKPVPGARVVLKRFQQARIVSYGVEPVIGGSTAITDSAGRFVLRGVAESDRIVVVMSDSLQFLQVTNTTPGAEMHITLPEPASLIVHYDIPDDLPEAKVELDYLVGGVLEFPSWNAFARERHPFVPNHGSITLTNLMPGTYDFIRMKELSVGDVNCGQPIEQTRIVLESGQHESIELVRTNGFPVRGTVIGITNTEAAGALLYVRSSEATEIPWAPTMTMQSTFDALACGRDGQFQTALLAPGNYTIEAEAYKPEVPDFEDAEGKRIRVFRSGIRLPDYVGSANVTVTADRAPEPVKIELLPRKIETNQPSARRGNGQGGTSSSNPQASLISDTTATNVITGKVIDVETRQPFSEADWGEPVEGVQVRLHAARTMWTTNESPQLLVDIRNHGVSRFICSTNYLSWDLEVDGRWHFGHSGYRWGGGTGPHADETLTNFQIDTGFYSVPDLPDFGPGKHVLRMKLDGFFDQTGPDKFLQVTSNPVEIEIAPPVSVSRSDWGEPVEGVQVRLHALRTHWTTNESPELLLDIANHGVTRFDYPTNFAMWSLQVDDKSYRAIAGTGIINRQSGAPSPGQTVTNLPLRIAGWFRDAAEGLEWLQLTPGKHTMRVGLSGSQDDALSRIAEVFSNPVEIEMTAAALATNSTDSDSLRTAPQTRNGNRSYSLQPAPRTIPPSGMNFSGRVVDAATGTPIPDFIVQQGWIPFTNTDQPIWVGHSEGKAQAPGFWQAYLEQSDYGFRFVAPDYLPEIVPKETILAGNATNIEVRLRRGGELTGTVLDDAGRPVSGMDVFLATLEIPFMADGKPINQFHSSTATTDEAGRFTLRGVDEMFPQKVIVASADRKFQWLAVQSEPRKPLKIRLPKPGTLIVQYDIPSESEAAEIRVSREFLEPGWQRGSQALFRTLTMTNGSRVVLAGITPGTYLVERWKSAGFALRAVCDQKTIVIDPGQTRSAIFVRTNGQPVSGRVEGIAEAKANTSVAYIAVRAAGATGQPWPEQSPNHWRESNLLYFDVRQTTTDGSFQTALLKPGNYSVIAQVYRPGAKWSYVHSTNNDPIFVGATNVTVTEATAPQAVTIRLERVNPAMLNAAVRQTSNTDNTDQKSSNAVPAISSVTITGHVVDAETREPIPEFTVTPGYAAAPDLLPWIRAKTSRQTNGFYRVLEDPPALILIEAPGYMPTMPATWSWTNSSHDFVLQKGSAFEGRVFGTDGKPAEGVQVAFNARYSVLTLDKTGLGPWSIYHVNTNSQHSPIVKTDTYGSFHLPAIAGIVSILAVDAQGFSEVPIEQFRQSPVIQLKSWGRIEGKLLSNGKPLANELVGINFTNYFFGHGFRFANGDLQTSTDDSGHFVFDRVPPDDFNLNWTDPATDKSESRLVKVELGKTTTVELDSTNTNLISGEQGPTRSLNRGTNGTFVFPRRIP